ncbi:MAG: hypothetical protein ABFD92_08075 [Planctomycetaceae bacterium]|nr:hypothetical protein [Planctomycetaceae bacterium]
MPMFSLKTYEHLIRSLGATARPFVTFARGSAGLALRLDVDYDLALAAAVAAINQRLGVRGTFFIQVSSAVYNACSPADRQAIAQIGEAGQFIGLHHDARGTVLDSDQLQREYDVLERLTPQVQRVVAWHNPPADTASLDAAAEKAGFLSTYCPEFFGPDRYVSDSNCRHRAEQIAAFAGACRAPLVQVLLHPVIWSFDADGMEDVLAALFGAKVNQLGRDFMQNRLWTNALCQRALRMLDAEVRKA